MAAIAYFGRAYQLSIDTQDGQHLVVRSLVSAGEQPLRVSFDIHTYMMPTAYWDANFTIWNLNRAGSSLGGALPVGQGGANSLGYNQRITAGDVVAFSAGYDAGANSQPFSAERCFLWAGSVFQPVWTRVNVVDFKLTLRCLYGLMQESLNLIDFSMYGSSPTYYDTLAAICKKASVSESIDADAEAKNRLQQGQYIRGFRDLAKPADIVHRIMRDSTLFAWVTPPAPNSGGQQSTLHVRSFDVAPTKADIAYQPPNVPASPFTLSSNVKPTLLGIPEQMGSGGGIGITQNGVIFRVLLDPEVRVGMVVQLVAGTIVNPYQFSPFQEYPSLPSRNALYVVAGVRHVGDSRGTGDDWYTEITGVLWDFFSAYVKATMPGSKP